tara:strand:+ start:510 stop:710 length:201 start_codon:yes stop_codon:yes gene_type:complete
MISLSSCKEKPKVGRNPTFSLETKKGAIKACSMMKKREHNWKNSDIKEYCSKQWRGYIEFIKETER